MSEALTIMLADLNDDSCIGPGDGPDPDPSLVQRDEDGDGTGAACDADDGEPLDSDPFLPHLFGVWAAARHNLEIPKGYWKLAYKHYEATQNRDGGWGYGYTFGGGTGSKGTMTAAGLAGLFVAFDNLQSGEFTKCGANHGSQLIVHKPMLL